MPPAPFYLDWAFWAVVAAGISIILSQLPPVLSWFKIAEIDLDVYSKVSITHKVGNPNLQLHLIITNVGGRKVRVEDINVTLTREGGELVSLPAQNYLQNQHDEKVSLLVPFSLSPTKEWAHIVNFLNYFDRIDGNNYQRIEDEMRKHLRDNLETLREQPDPIFEHDSALVTEAIEFFNSQFIWESGEYIMFVNVCTSDELANISKEFRFTIFESHTDQLKKITEDYKAGAGIYWTPSNPSSPLNVILPISETK